MALKVMPHGRLQEWVADENGYFTAEGLEYSFVAEGAMASIPGRATRTDRSPPVRLRPSGPGATART